MKIKRFTHRVIVALTSSLLLYSCAGNKLTATAKLIAEANKFATNADYTTAYDRYTQMESRQEWDSVTYRLATISASKTDHDSIARAWGRHYLSTNDTLKLTALNKSLCALGKDSERAELAEQNTALFIEKILGEQPTYSLLARHYAKTNNSKLKSIYTHLTETADKTKLFGTYFNMVRKEVDDKEATTLCREALKDNPNDVVALNYMAVSTYNNAESKYKKTMDDYNKNKTQAAYAYMSRDLKRVITPMYKQSRDYFERLRKAEPDNKNNVRYLINIYRRLDNKQKVQELEKLL